MDLVALIIENLGRRKARVALTAIGVVIGTAAIVVLVSLAIGLQMSANENLMMGDLTQIMVEPNYGEGGPGPVVVEVAGTGKDGSAPPNQTLITNQTLEELAAIPGVTQVIPRDFMQGEGTLKFGQLESWAGITGIGLRDLSELDLDPQGGTLQLERGAAIIGSDFAMNFYDPLMRPGQEAPSPPDLRSDAQLTLKKYDNEGNGAQIAAAAFVV
jgi:putative ABC transport system permease protein